MAVMTMKCLSAEIWHIPEGFSEHIATTIDEEVKRIIDDAHTKAHSMIEEHMEVLHKCAKLLIEKEKIGREEFEALF